MSLSSPNGRAPLEPVGRHTGVALPERVRYWEPWPRRRALLDGRTVVDSRRAVMLWQTGPFPDLYYPRADIDAELIAGSGTAGSEANRNFGAAGGGGPPT